MALIRCQDLSLGYDGREILRDLNFTVHSGDYLCIVGENGSGKSTLMRTILGLQAPLAGKIVTGDGLRRTEIGYLPQQTAVQRDFPATVWEIVLSGCQGRRGLSPFYSRADKALAREMIGKMGLASLERRCYRELSGGQQQRVLLSRALCATRKLLLLDEPVSGLDPSAAAEMYEIIETLNRSEGITILMISHDVSAALRYASHILHIGDTVFFGTRGEYLDSGLESRFITGEPELRVSGTNSLLSRPDTRRPRSPFPLQRPDILPRSDRRTARNAPFHSHRAEPRTGRREGNAV